MRRSTDGGAMRLLNAVDSGIYALAEVVCREGVVRLCLEGGQNRPLNSSPPFAHNCFHTSTRFGMKTPNFGKAICLLPLGSPVRFSGRGLSE